VPNDPRAGRPCLPERWREYRDACLYVPSTGCAAATPGPTTSL
jgi:hypothetical protein